MLSFFSKIPEKDKFQPFFILFFLFAAAAAALIFHLPQNVMAGVVLIFLLAVSFFHPANGIAFLLMIVPFFLGNSKRPYYFLLEVLVSIVILTFAITWFVKKKKGLLFPYRRLIVIFFFISLASLPLNIKEFYFYCRGFAADTGTGSLVKSLFMEFCSSHEGKHIYWLRTVVNLLTGISLYVVTVNSFKDKNQIKKLFFPLLIVFLSVLSFGYLFLFKVIPHQGSYLGMSLFGKQGKWITAFAYNRGYLAQYIIVFLPLVGFYLSWWKKNKTLFILSLISVFTGIVTIAFTFQRGPILALCFEMLLFSVLYISVSRTKKKNFIILSALFFCVFTVLFGTDYFLFKGRGINRLIHSIEKPGRRPMNWKVAYAMSRERPVLGVGTGKYHHFFPQYCQKAGVPFRKLAYSRTTAHNLYLHLLAERGALGLICFLLLIAFIFKEFFQTIRIMDDTQSLVAVCLLVSIGGWLAYGMTQYMFYIRSMGIFFWIILGFLSVLLRPFMRSVKISKKACILTGIICVVLFCYRFWMVYHFVV